MWKPLAEERAAKIAQLEKRLAEREESTPPPWPSKRSITVILTVHGDKRLQMARDAYQSILNAGFGPDQIRICLTCPPSGYGKAYSEFSGHSYLDDLGPIDNNAAWLESCRRAQSSHIIILHDDDLMKPGLRAKLKERDDWEVAYWDADLIGEIQSPIRYFRCKPGVYDGRVVRDIQTDNGLTISTIQGCFPRHLAIGALSRFAEEFNQPDFLFRPGMWVGNDFLLWWVAGGCSKVWITGETFSQCRGHVGSTTAIGLENGTIRPMYGEMRRRLSATKKKRVVIGHAFGKTDGFCRHFESIKTDHPIIFLCHSATQRIPSNATRMVIPDIGLKIKCPNGVEMKDHCAKFIFPQACKAALDGGFDEMMWIETDCRFAGDGWDQVLAEEHAGAGDVVASGSPVAWHTLAKGHKLANKTIEFCSRYYRQTGRMVALEGPTIDGPPSLYPNGAIAWYSSELMQECFVSRIPNGWEQFSEAEPFDLAVGRYIWSRFEELSFNKVGILNSSYSGCLDHWYSLNDRLQMLASGKIVAVHQVKS